LESSTAPPAPRKRNGKPPAFQFYAKDWLTSGKVRAMTLAGRGLFIDLLAFAWDNHGLPLDEQTIRRSVGCDVREWRRNWQQVVTEFEPRGDRLVNRKQELVRAAMDELSAKRAQAARIAVVNKRHANGPANGPASGPANGQPSSASSSSPSRGGGAGSTSEMVLKPKRALRHPGADDAGFTAFWLRYPRKVGKGAAVRAWAKIRPGPALVADILAAVDGQRESWQWRRDNGQYVPHPATWLNERRWEDEPEPATPPTTRPEEDEWKREKARLLRGLVPEKEPRR
jgi:uncharacterized protein YdaU (DUF1376 family)